ncbi:hypothetical protein [Lachnotalea glycerini]|uniref:DUF3859 domain-containing protein n=1 Tax=Lachnotalea glycerini TaxID=1763509 RepID=A0A371J383_9FIRM|nr:hypothetical protein [Lachnotalea glycerini]RDY27137.1 hypothetical protein CG710_021100 [Lachnotalea glycerini]
MNKLKKRTLGVLLAIVTAVNIFTTPVMAAESINTAIEANTSVSSETNYTYAGTINGRGGTISLGLVTLLRNKLYIYLPRNNNLDLFQGSVLFISGNTTISKNISNMGAETWIFNASDIGAGIWQVRVTGYAVGTTQKCNILYKVVY